ncbi:hypothetical protein [Chitinimonas naiadis]
MMIALWLVLGVIIGVGCLVRSASPCLLCRQRGQCNKADRCAADVAPVVTGRLVLEIKRTHASN